MKEPTFEPDNGMAAGQSIGERGPIAPGMTPEQLDELLAEMHEDDLRVLLEGVYDSDVRSKMEAAYWEMEAYETQYQRPEDTLTYHECAKILHQQAIERRTKIVRTALNTTNREAPES